ncbi:MAG TPA: hypothetical protein VLA31_03960 [Burkholderiaceae bacterium]|nr:hypothetical protein [Burkholderiaceae bacterium]
MPIEASSLGPQGFLARRSISFKPLLDVCVVDCSMAPTGGDH